MAIHSWERTGASARRSTLSFGSGDSMIKRKLAFGMAILVAGTVFLVVWQGVVYQRAVHGQSLSFGDFLRIRGAVLVHAITQTHHVKLIAVDVRPSGEIYVYTGEVNVSGLVFHLQRVSGRWQIMAMGGWVT